MPPYSRDDERCDPVFKMLNNKILCRLKRSSKGAFLVSFLGVLPLLLALGVLLIDMTRLQTQRLQIDHAVTQAAREGIKFLPDTDRAEQAVRSHWGHTVISRGFLPRDVVLDVLTSDDFVDVQARVNVTLFLAPVFGLADSDVVANVRIVVVEE